MPDYSKGKIYKIYSPTKPELGVYVGGTCASLNERMRGHRHSSKRIHHYCSNKEIMKEPDAVIELIEDCPCSNVKELDARERYWIENTENCVNRIHIGRTRYEYSRLPKMIEYRAKYYQEHKEKVKEYSLGRRDIIYERKNKKVKCVCGDVVSLNNIHRHKKSKGCIGSWSALS